MASLDFSSDKFDGIDPQVGSHNLDGLVDETSLGTRSKDGMYEVRDWVFSKQVDDEIALALQSKSSTPVKEESKLGAFGSIFARLTGGKVLNEEDLKPVLDAMKQHLMKKNVAKEISEKVCEGVGEGLIGKKVGGFQCLCIFCLHPVFLT
jgi:signal recognition particle receptor subunit alpha